MATDAASGITIRAATIEDEAVLTSLVWRLTTFTLPPWRTPESIVEADAREMMAAIRAATPENAVVIADRDGAAVGCLHILETVDFFGTRHAHISVIATTAEAEGSGVGRILMEYAERWAANRGHSLLTLNVFAANARARRFYERAGYGLEMMKYSKSV